MKIDRLSVNTLGYNPEQEAIEALVVLSEAGETYAYPVQMRAPLTAEFGFVTRILADKARRMHRHSPSREMRLHRTPVPAQGQVEAAMLSSEPLHPGAPLAA